MDIDIAANVQKDESIRPLVSLDEQAVFDRLSAVLDSNPRRLKRVGRWRPSPSSCRRR